MRSVPLVMDDVPTPLLCRFAGEGVDGTPSKSSSSFVQPLETNPPRHPRQSKSPEIPAEPHIDYQKLGRTTPYDPAIITPLESTFRHSGWAARRGKVWEALKTTGQTENRLNAFAQCGSALFVQVAVGGGESRLTCNACHDRFCTACGNTRSRVISSALDGLMQQQTTRFVTLTKRAADVPLKDQLDTLYRNFSVLRRRKWWREHIPGGAAFLEVKIGKNSGLWHCHLHIIAACPWFSQAELSAEWHAVTNDSFIVDVRECTDPAGRSRYVTKYVTKPASSEVYSDPKRLGELITALKGRRLCMTFGTWRGTPLDPNEPAEGEWKSAGSLEDVMHHAKAGSSVHLGILINLQARYPTFPAVVEFFDRQTRPPPA